MRWLQQPEVCALQLWVRRSSHLPGINYESSVFRARMGYSGMGHGVERALAPVCVSRPQLSGLGPTRCSVVWCKVLQARVDKGNRACLLLSPAEFTHRICTPAHRTDPAAAVISRQPKLERRLLPLASNTAGNTESRLNGDAFVLHRTP